MSLVDVSARHADVQRLEESEEPPGSTGWPSRPPAPRPTQTFTQESEANHIQDVPVVTESERIRQARALGVSDGQIEVWMRSGILHLIPVDEEGMLTSIGTTKHAEGECQPCIFWFRGECNRGLKCDHCHLVHPGQKRKRIRPSKATRLWRRRHEQVAGVDDLFDEVDLAELTPPHDESGTSLNQSRDEVDATWVGPEQPGRAAPSVAQVGAWPSYMFEDAGDPGPAVCFETVEWSELGPRTSLPAVAGNAAGSAEAMDSRTVSARNPSAPSADPMPPRLGTPPLLSFLHRGSDKSGDASGVGFCEETSADQLAATYFSL